MVKALIFAAITVTASIINYSQDIVDVNKVDNLTIFSFLDPETELLFTSKYCNPCQEAKTIIKRLQKQGYDVKIIDIHGKTWERQLTIKYQIERVPTLIVRQNGFEIDRLTGLQTEGEYRSVISKKPLSQEPINLTDFTGAINFTNGQEPETIVYNLIVRRAKRSGYGYLEINPNERLDLAKQFEITKLPTLLLLKDGVEVGRYVGTTPLEIENGEEEEEVDAKSC